MSNGRKPTMNHTQEAEQKLVASIPLDSVIAAYLRGEQEKLAVKLKEAEEEKQKSGEQMVAQLNRILGQKEGAIEQIKLQMQTIAEQLGPQVASKTIDLLPEEA